MTSKTNTKIPELSQAHMEFSGVKPLFLDGEPAFLGKHNETLTGYPIVQKRRSSGSGFQALSEQYPLTFVAFDILLLNNKKITRFCYDKRRQILQKVLRAPPLFLKIVTQHNNIKEAWRKCIEGIVAKNRNMPYFEGVRHFSWFKVKRLKEIDVVITGAELGGTGLLKEVKT